MMMDATIAVLHYLSIILLVVFLSAEAVLCKPEYVSAATIRRLAIYDALYFAFAIATLATGLARAFWGAKGIAFYAGNVFFWAKIAVFVLIALMSIAPTLAFLRWRKRLKQDASALPAADEVLRARRWVMREAHWLALLPVFAVLMARGIGL